MPREQMVWVFMGDGARNPSAVFRTKDTAERWIGRHGLTGMLSEYPLDRSVLDWALENEYFKPKDERSIGPGAQQTFTSAAQRHHHYRQGHEV